MCPDLVVLAHGKGVPTLGPKFLGTGGLNVFSLSTTLSTWLLESDLVEHNLSKPSTKLMLFHSMGQVTQSIGGAVHKPAVQLTDFRNSSIQTRGMFLEHPLNVFSLCFNYVECVEQISQASCSHAANAVEEPVLKALIEASGAERWEFDTTRGVRSSGILSNT